MPNDRPDDYVPQADEGSESPKSEGTEIQRTAGSLATHGSQDYLMARLKDYALQGTIEERRAQEVALARAMEAGVFAWAALEGLFPLPESCANTEGRLTPQGQSELEQIVERGAAARQRLALANVGMVIRLAKRSHISLELDDRISVALVGLFHYVLPQYDYERSMFTTAIGSAGRRALSEAQVAEGQLVQKTKYMLELIVKMRKAERELTAAGGKATPEAIGSLMGKAAEDIRMLLQADRIVLSLDQPIDNEDGASEQTFGDAIVQEDDPYQTERIVFQLGMRQEVRALLQTLSPDDRRIVGALYGFDDGSPKTATEVAKMIGTSAPKIRVRLKGILEELRQRAAERGIEPTA